MRIKATLRVSKDRGTIAWRMDSLESKFAKLERILSYDLPGTVPRGFLIPGGAVTDRTASISEDGRKVGVHLGVGNERGGGV